ncbi:MAG: hypothetical protein EA397_02920 [Deltaproteobacteria bacterium]|nr:MAG: hypothetical protein EA397_02920 [Deltaproteobacteria bacterium]
MILGALLGLGAAMAGELRIDSLWDGTPAEPGEVVLVAVEGDRDHLLLTVDAPYHGDPAPPGPRGSTWRLWDYEVVEVFVAGLGQPVPYLEVELGPHGHHLVLQLQGERNVVQSGLVLEYQVTIDSGRWRGTARVPRSYLPLAPHRINAYAIHGQGAERRYLAWSPTLGEQPDFHRLKSFRPYLLP